MCHPFFESDYIYYSFSVFFCKILYKNRFNLLFIFHRFTEMKIKSFESLSQKGIIKKMLGTSDAWLTSHLSQQTSDPAFYTQVRSRLHISLWK